MRTPEDAPTDPDALVRYATIASVDLASARATVTLDDGVISPPLLWLAPRMGETRAWSPPSVGEQVLVLCPCGELAAGVIVGGVPSTKVPVPASSKMTLIHFSDGAAFSYDPEAHALAIELPSGATTTLTSDGGITFTGKLTLNGDLAQTGSMTTTGDIKADGDVQAGTISLTSHLHGGVASGAAKTAVPE